MAIEKIEGEWRRGLAWYPMKIEGRWIWLCRIERRNITCIWSSSTGEDYIRSIDYRLIRPTSKGTIT